MNTTSNTTPAAAQIAAGSLSQETSLTDPRQVADNSPFPFKGLCEWCSCVFGKVRSDMLYCSKRCRQTAWRLSRELHRCERNDKPMRIAYADPPYPGKAKRYYRDHPDFGGEVDHAELVAHLASAYEGWALSTSSEALGDVLPLCPPGVHVCAWVKPIGAWPKTFGLQSMWEPLIVKPARELRPGKRDWLSAQPARGGGKLIGRKPIKFCAFLFDAIGMLPGDSLDDLYPGTGVVLRAWENFASKNAAEVGK